MTHYQEFEQALEELVREYWEGTFKSERTGRVYRYGCLCPLDNTHTPVRVEFISESGSPTSFSFSELRHLEKLE